MVGKSNQSSLIIFIGNEVHHVNNASYPIMIYCLLNKSAIL